jgi:tetratricopeptide (TPR) repeat protein
MANAIKKYPVPLIFKKILKDRLSGELIVTGNHFTKTLFFIDGRLAFATSTLTNEDLGEILVSGSKVTRRQLEHALEIIRKPSFRDRQVGEILVKLNYLDKRDYYYTLRDMVKTIAVSTLPLKEGEWRFIVKTPEIPNRHSFKIKLPDIIYEGIKGIEDVSYFKKRFVYKATVTTPISEVVSNSFTPDEMKLYTELSTFSNTSVEQLLMKLDIRDDDSKLRFWQTLMLFYYLNAVDFVEYTVDEEQNKNIEEINDLYEKIKSKDLNYYQLFGVENPNAVEEVKKTYFDYSRKYHPDRINAAPDSTVMLKANEVFAEINKAFEVLSDSEKKKEYDNRGYREDSEVEPTQTDKVKNIRNLYLKANRLYKEKQYFEAVVLLEQVVSVDSSRSTYFLLLGLAQSKLPTMINQAVKNLEKACELEPWNADPVFALGELYRSQQMVKKAERYFQKALEINMEHTLAGKAISDLEKMFHPKKSKFSLFGKKK